MFANDNWSAGGSNGSVATFAITVRKTSKGPILDSVIKAPSPEWQVSDAVHAMAMLIIDVAAQQGLDRTAFLNSLATELTEPPF